MENSRKLAELFGVLSREAEKAANTLQEISECIGEEKGARRAAAQKPAAQKPKAQKPAADAEPVMPDEKIADAQMKTENAEPATTGEKAAEGVSGPAAENTAEGPVSKDTIHDLMVKLTLAKKTEQVKAILSDYAPRLSSVEEADYPELFKRLKELEVK